MRNGVGGSISSRCKESGRFLTVRGSEIKLDSTNVIVQSIPAEVRRRLALMLVY